MERALEETRHGSPAAIRIRGYDDYIYRETITRGYRMGSLSTPVVISAYTADELGTAPVIRPIIDGGITVGSAGWTRPWSVKYPHVWCKTWKPGPNLLTGARVPPGYDSAYNSVHEDRLFMDGSQPLHRPATVPTIAQLNRQPYTQYWDRTKSTKNLCVHPGPVSYTHLDVYKRQASGRAGRPAPGSARAGSGRAWRARGGEGRSAEHASTVHGAGCWSRVLSTSPA